MTVSDPLGTLQPARRAFGQDGAVGASSNGRTPVFGSVNRGSNPRAPAKRISVKGEVLRDFALQHQGLRISDLIPEISRSNSRNLPEIERSSMTPAQIPDTVESGSGEFGAK